MEKLEKKRNSRKLLVESRRKNKVISEYVKVKYPEVFVEASECYKKLDELYPERRDLCKAVEFILATTGTLTNNQYYYNKRLQRKTVEKAAKTTPTTPTNPEMVLQIPLLPVETVNAQATLDIPGAAEVITEVQEDPVLRAVFEERTAQKTPQVEGAAWQSPVQQFNEPLQVEDTTYQRLVQELLNDPILQDAFDDIEINDPSPLENELMNVGV